MSTQDMTMEYDTPIHSQEHRRFLGLRASAIVEIFAFFVIALVIQYLFGTSPRFIDSWPHPFWVIVILISAQYGSNEGLFAVLAASLVLLVGNLPEQRIDQDFYDWLLEVAARPMMWLVTAVILGEIRLRHIRERDILRNELEDSRRRESTFADSYEKVRARKERLELNIASRVRTETDALRAAKAIEKLNPDQVIDGVTSMVSSAIGAEKFSLFLLNRDTLSRHLTEGWTEEDEDALNTSYRAQDHLYQAVIARKETLCVINEEHEHILDGQGILAGPLLDTETGNIIGMLKIEAMPFLELNLEAVESFRALCEWIALAISNARYYQSAVSDTTVNPEHNLMTKGFFNRYRDYITALARRLKFNVFTLNVDVVNHTSLDADTRIKVARILSKTVDKTLRNVDFAFDHQQSGGHYAIVLPATDKKGAKIVQEKIEKALLKATNKEARGVHYTFTLNALHEEA